MITPNIFILRCIFLFFHLLIKRLLNLLLNLLQKLFIERMKKLLQKSGAALLLGAVLTIGSVVYAAATIPAACAVPGDCAELTPALQNVSLEDDIKLTDADGSNYVGFQSAATVAADTTWTLPAADGTTGQVLSTDGSGILSWISAAAGNFAALTDTDFTELATGATTYFDGTNWVDLPAGTAGQALVMNTGATAPEWFTVPGMSATLYTGNGIIGAGRTVGITDTVNFDSNTFVIDGTNNEVGIGTSSPDAELHISNTTNSDTQIRLTNDARTYSIKTRDVGTGADSFVIGDETAVEERFVIDPTGNVGIGVTTPRGILDMNPIGITSLSAFLGGGNLSTGVASFEIGNGRTSDGISHIDLTGDTTYTDFGTRLIRNNGANAVTELIHRGTGALRLISQDAGGIALAVNGADRVLVENTGNVGIGTNASIDLAIGDGDTGFEQTADGVLDFMSNGTAVATVKNGSLGIATNDPQFELAIGDSDTGIDWFSDGQIGMVSNNAEVVRFTTGKLTIRQQDGVGEGGEIAFDGSNGQSQYLIDNFNDGTSQDFRVVQGGDVRAFIQNGVNGWQTPSDRRLKSDIETLSVLDNIDAVRGAQYTLKDSGEIEVGVIAQEVQQAFPHAVSGDEKEGFLGVSYNAIASIALQGVKELKSWVSDIFDGLDSRVTELEAENAELKARLDAIEAKLAN